MKTKFFSINSHCDLDLDLDPITLKRKLVRGIVIYKFFVKVYQNWIINEVARVMTKGEHTYKRTYVYKFVRDRPYIPSTPSLCEGIIILSATVKLQRTLTIMTVYVTIDFAGKSNLLL